MAFIPTYAPIHCRFDQNMLLHLYRHSWRRFLLAAVCGMLSGFAGAGVVRLISRSTTDHGQLPLIASTFFLLCAAQVICKACSEIALVGLTQEMICRLRIGLSRKLLATPFKTLESLGKARLLVTLTADVDTFSQAGQLLPAVFGNSMVVLVCVGYMAFLSWQVFLGFTTFLLVSAVAYQVCETWPLQQMRKVREQMDVVYRHFRSLLDGTRELQLNRERGGFFVQHVIGPSARHSQALFVRATIGYSLVANAGGALFFVVIGLLLFVLPTWFPQPPTTVVAVTFLLLYLIQPITFIMTALPFLRQSAIALARIRQLDHGLTGSAEPSHALGPNPFVHAVAGAPLLRLKRVCHQFAGLTEDRPFILGPIDLSIRAGETVFLVGGNGSGKTTLAMLLLGLYEPERGSIELNGIPVDAGSVVHYRQWFSAVFADFHLFDEVLCGNQQEVPEQAASYLSRLQIADKVKVESGRFSTTSLSLGQRKRMALVSAYLEDRPIYLFDEWAADQDPAFKWVFYRELLPELKARGKTVLVISHDDAYFNCADRLLKLDRGVLLDEQPMNAPGRSVVLV
jgi:putative ATP-binding cassette transporter